LGAIGVRYVLEGSVRKAGNRVRITGQLIEAATGTHLWAERFDGRLEDVFDLQDEVTASVVGLIAPKLERVEIERARRKPTESLDAYDYYLRGMAAYEGATKEANEEALRLYSKAIALDPAFASPYAMAARCYALRRVNGWTIDRATEVAEATRLVRRAVGLSNDDAVVLGIAGYILAYVTGDLAGGATYVDRARTLIRTSHSFGHIQVGWTFAGGGLRMRSKVLRTQCALAHSIRQCTGRTSTWRWVTFSPDATMTRLCGRKWCCESSRIMLARYVPLPLVAHLQVVLRRHEAQRHASARSIQPCGYLISLTFCLHFARKISADTWRACAWRGCRSDPDTPSCIGITVPATLLARADEAIE
jgi:hypothetical protein